MGRFFKKTITWLYLKNEHQNRKKIVGKLIGKKKADKSAQKAFSLAKSVLQNKTSSFIYTLNEE